MNDVRNIAMQLTAPGAAAIAVIRLSGPGTKAFLQKHFSKEPGISRCVHGNLTDAGWVVDDAVVVLSDETTADLNVHGGSWVVTSVLELARREGFEVVESRPDGAVADVTVDAVTELGRELLRFLPLARTETGVRVLLEQEQAWRYLKERERDELSRELEQILTDQTLIHLLFPPTVAIVGRANVGKSTLANQLFAQARSITADVPGTTRDWVGELANIDGLPVMLVDTPGMRETEDPIERVAIERGAEQIARSRLVVLVLDATRPLAGEQQVMLERFPGALLVVNKIDRPAASEMDGLPALRTIATTGQGVQEVREKVVEFFCGTASIVIDRPRIWTERQRQIVRNFVEGSGSLDLL
jgi:tRNA modification GTPase